MAALSEIDSLEILVIVDNEVDPISTYSNPAVQATGNIVDIGMRSQSDVHDRGDAAKELRMDSICCGAHGLSLMIVCYINAVRSQRAALLNSLCRIIDSR
jgi:7,8-dihydropterin-6-yl-methyl-4-(beta-D-ribofuranosyl)aminobenzene 5'-phosphate synthase